MAWLSALGSRKTLSLLLLFICISFIPQQAESYVMGIDLGTEWFKVSLVKQKFEIVLNEQSSRKTATALTIQKGDVVIGTEAKNLISKLPKSTYVYAVQLLGRDLDDPIVQGSMPHFYYPVVALEDGTLQIRYDENTTFTPIDIVGMILEYAKDIATKAAGFTVRDAVITIPPYWTQRQRQALLDAAKLAGVTVTAFVNENTAAGVHYGIERTFTEDDTYVVFYDIGGSSLTTSLLSYKNVPGVDAKTKKNVTNEQLTVEAVSWDPLLGGREFDLRIAQHFARLVSAQVKEEISPKETPKVFAKLLKAAQKAKEILSANKQAATSVESVVGDYDFQTTITREEFEEMCADLFDRALIPIADLFTKSGVSMKDVRDFEVIGGGVRIPKLQQKILDYLNRGDLGKHVNGDEANVMGAAFVAATKSASFRVKDFKIKDFSPFGTTVELKSDNDLEKKAELFPAGARVGSKKTLSFSTDQEFSVEISYDVSDARLPAKTHTQIAKYRVSGVPNSDGYNMTSKPKISASFRINSFGMFGLEDAEAEISVITFPIDSGVESPEGAESEGEESAGKIEREPVVTARKVKLNIVQEFSFEISKEQQQASQKLLREIRERSEAKREKEREKNNLEAYVYDMRQKLETSEYIEFTNEEQRTEFTEKLSKAADWLYEEGADTTSYEYRTKLRELTLIGDKIKSRISERAERPKEAMKLTMYILQSKNLLENITERLEVSEDELEKVLESIKETEKWLEEKTEAQEAVKLYEDPVLSSSDILIRQRILESEIRPLTRRPKKKVVKPVEATIETIEIPAENAEEGAENAEIPIDAELETEPELKHTETTMTEEDLEKKEEL